MSKGGKATAVVNCEVFCKVSLIVKERFLVSAVISTYCSEKFIGGCLLDLIEQTLYQKGELEIIVIDSASPEKEKLIVENFQGKYPHIIYERTPERETIYEAWNRAIKMAKGNYITNANTDDRRHPQALEIMANYLDSYPDVALVYADQLITTIPNDTFLTTKATRRWHWPEYSYQELRQRCCVGSQPMWRKSLHSQYGYFGAEFSCAGDYEFWLRLGSQGEKMRLIPQILGLYYFNSEGVEHRDPKTAWQETNLVRQQYNIPIVPIPATGETESKNLKIESLGVALTDADKRQVREYQGNGVKSYNLQLITTNLAKKFPRIVIDGVFFQIAKSKQSGIAQVWQSLLQEWSVNNFADHVIVLDRVGTTPFIAGINYYPIRAYDYQQTAVDAKFLQAICEQLQADLFISTYYTTPLTTPSIFMAYDLIPEVMEANLDEPCWQEKHYGISHAIHYLSISENTKQDLIKFYPHIPERKVTVAHCGLKPVFYPPTNQEISQFKTKFNIDKPYFLLVGERIGVNNYKNAIAFFQALSKLDNKQELAVVSVGGTSNLEPELSSLTEGIKTIILSLNDQELRAAYGGSIAYICPSLYEGFGLPILEAMACGCPVIASNNSSIPEVGGEAIWYVDSFSEEELIKALQQVQKAEIRQLLREKGLQQASKFSWSRMADIIAETLLTKSQEIKAGIIMPSSPIWKEFREQQIKLNSSLKKLKEYQKLVQEEQENITKTNSDLLQQLEKISRELEIAHQEIKAMKSSKFWKLRHQWFQVKKALSQRGIFDN